MIRQKLQTERTRSVLLLTGLAFWILLAGPVAVTPALAQGAGTPPILEKPAAPEEKKEEAPTTCGPLISDTCMPIQEQHASLQVLWGLSFYPGVFSNNWRTVSARGNYHTFIMPVKFTYGPTKDLELYIIAPFIRNWVSGVNRDVSGPNGETSASYSGIGDLTLMGKYNLTAETDYLPAVTAVGGFASIPTGRAHRLNPGLLGQDAIGTGALTFTTGVNLYKWVKPFLLYSNIWLNSPINLFKSEAGFTPQPVRSREYVTFNLAAELPLSSRFVALLEMYSTWTWNNLITTPQGYQTPQTVLGILPGIEFLATEKVSIAAGASIDLFGKNGVKKYTPMLTAYYAF